MLLIKCHRPKIKIKVPKKGHHILGFQNYTQYLNKKLFPGLLRYQNGIDPLNQTPRPHIHYTVIQRTVTVLLATEHVNRKSITRSGLFAVLLPMLFPFPQ